MTPRARSPLSALALAVVLALALRPGEPMGLAPAAPGLVPICAGGAILYVRLPGYEDPSLPEGKAPERSPCPWFGLTGCAAPPVPPALAARSSRRLATPRHSPADAAPRATTIAERPRSRAPPEGA